MKRLLSLIVVLVVLVGAFTSCDMVSNINLPWGNKIEEADIMDAIKELDDIYGDAEGSSTANDFELIAQLKVKDEETGISTVFTITWEASTPLVKIELVDGFWCVDVPEDLNEIVDYTLTATITSEGGQKATIEFGRKLPAGGMGMIANPVVGTAYKFALLHGNEKAVVYFDGNNYNNYAWYLAYTTDPLAAVDVYLESVEGVEDGYRLYFNKDGEKTYIVAFPRDGDTTKGTLKLDTECPEEYYTWNAEYNTLVYTSVTGESFYIGSSGTYKSISLSAISYITGGTSYVAHLYGPGGVKEELPVQELPEIPENYTSQDLVDALYKLESGQTIEETYELTGIVTSIKYAYDPSYSNVSVNIVVEGREDKPVLLYRITGDGADTLKVGDTVTVRAGLTNYGGTYETTSGGLIINIVPGDGTVPGLPDNPGTDNPEKPSDAVASLDLTTNANLVSGSANQNVFAQNGITLTNDKASSSSDLVVREKFSQRMYKGSTVKIEYKGMTKIVITLDDYEDNGKTYLAGFDGMTVEGATIVRDGAILTIYFSAPTDVFQSKDLASQTRIKTVEVYTGEVETPDQGGTDTPSQPSTPTYTAPEVGKAYYFYLEQKGLNKTLYFKGVMDGDYLATTEDKTAAAQIYFEAVEGGYHIYFTDAAGAKTYINAAAYLKSNGYAGCHFSLGSEPNCVWTYNTQYGILEVYDEVEGKSDTFFAGTYGTYNTISLSGAYYKDQINSGSQYPARLAAVDVNTDTPVEPEQPEQPEQPDTPVNPGEDTAGLVGKAYYLYLEQKGLNKTLYFKGVMDGDYLATTEDKTAAAQIYFEAVEGGYHIYFTDAAGAKTYINAAAYLKSNGYAGCHFSLGSEPNCVWTYNTQYGILEVYDEVEGKSDTFFAGTYGTYNTISLSGAYYKDQINSGSQYPARLAAVDVNTDTPVEPEQPEQPDTPSQPEDGVMSIPEVLEASEGDAVVVKGTVSDIYQVWDEGYSNMSFYISDDEGNSVLVFRTGTKVVVGDQVTVTGTATIFYEKVQIAQGSTTVIDVKHVCSEYTKADCTHAPECVVCGAANGTAAGHKYANGTCTVCGAKDVSTLQTTTVSNTISALAGTNGWTSDTRKPEFALDNVVSVKVDGGTYSGSVYTDHMRIYATDSPAGTLTISVAEGYELVSIKVTTVEGTYAFLTLDGATDLSNETVSVSGSSVTFTTVKNGSNGKQVRVLAIEVVYAYVN